MDPPLALTVSLLLGVPAVVYGLVLSAGARLADGARGASVGAFRRATFVGLAVFVVGAALVLTLGAYFRHEPPGLANPFPQGAAHATRLFWARAAVVAPWTIAALVVAVLGGAPAAVCSARSRDGQKWMNALLGRERRRAYPLRAERAGPARRSSGGGRRGRRGGGPDGRAPSGDA